jgi:nucleoside-diphosphate-sugar epimerase
MERILIAGCGYVGTALGRRLAASDDEVWGLRRSPGGLPPEIRPLAADLGELDSLAGLPPGLDVVIYAASAAGPTDDAYRAAYVDGLANLIQALVAGGQRPRRLLFTSSTAVYGQVGGEWVDEGSPTRPKAFSGRRLLEAEAVAAAAPFPAVVLRLAGIYGPGRTWLIDAVRRGEARCDDGPPIYTNRIHRDDAAGALAHLIALPEPDPLYLGVDCEPAERCEVLRWLAARLGAPPPAIGPAETAGGGPRRGGNKRCSNARLLASGYRFTYPSFRQGYGAMLVP